MSKSENIIGTDYFDVDIFLQKKKSNKFDSTCKYTVYTHDIHIL